MTLSLLKKLALACLCLLLGLAAVQADADCPHRNNKIECCETLTAKYNNKKYVTRYQCKKCDSGYKAIDNGEQCSNKISCKKGYGPPVNGMGKKCVECSDQNCSVCHSVFFKCSVCKKGYGMLDGVCVKLLLG